MSETDKQQVVPDAPEAKQEDAAEQSQGKSSGNGSAAGQSTGTSYLDRMDKVVTLDELQEDVEYDPEEYENFIKLYDDSLSEFKEGEVVTGRIVAISDKEVTVDIGFKSDGVIPIEEFSDPSELEVGQVIEIFLESVEDTDGQLVLSKKKADFMRNWERVIESYRKDEVIQGTCVRRIKGGIVVDLGGVDAFLPGSQIDVRPIRDFDAFIGKTMDFKIVKVNEMRKNIVVSHRVLVEKELQEQREKILANLEKGQILEGTVKNITDFGVFIDLGGVDGLLHINDLSWGRVKHPSELVQLDQKLKVMVIDFNEAKDRISLGLKQLQPEPWKEVDKKYPVGSVVTGKVVSIEDYGAFVELEKGVEGLIHISEMSWTQHIRHPSKILSVGETVEVKVIDLNVEERKISLSLRALQPDPWDQIEEKYPVGSRQKGIVRNLTNFGAFVELEEGIDGLVHISDLSWTKKIRHPGEVLKKGDEVEVVVLNVDKENRRISLGYKQTIDNPWPHFAEIYAVGKRTEGKIVRMIDKGVIVELPEGVDGFVPINHLAKEGLNKPSEAYAVGDTLELVVIDFNGDQKRIILSERIAKKAVESGSSGEELVIDEIPEQEIPADLEMADSTAEEEGGKKKAEKKSPAKKTKAEKAEAPAKTADADADAATEAPEAEAAAEPAQADATATSEAEAPETEDAGDADSDSEAASAEEEKQPEADPEEKKDE